MATVTEKKAAGPANKGLKVTSRPDSFRRAGYAFTAEARVIPLDQLSPEQYEMITTDKNLVSHVVDIEPPKEAEKAAAPEKGKK